MLRVLLTAFVFLPAAVAADRLEGKVADVPAGDTIVVLDGERRRHTVRLLGIDALERGQQGALRGRESLARYAAEQAVRVEWTRREPDGRLVGKAWVVPPDAPCRDQSDCPKTLDLGLAQLTVGRAWWSREDAALQTPEDRGRYEFAETEARAKRAGLWRHSNPTPPWEWRAARGLPR